MSFLNKQTFQLAEKESILTKHDDKKFSFSNTKKNDDIIGNVNSFREDLRKQITEKLRTTSKLIDTSSPKQGDGIKSLFSSRASDSAFQNDIFKRQLTAKSSEKKFDLVSDLLSKKQSEILPNKTAQKQADYFSEVWDRKRDSQRVSIKSIDVNSFFSGEAQEKRTISPFRDQSRNNEFGSTSGLKKSIAEKPGSFVDSKIGTRTPKQSLQEDINKLFETSKTPTNAGKENKLKIDTERSYKTLSQEISKLRNSRTNLLESSPKPKELTPKSQSNYFFTDLRDRDSEKDRQPIGRHNFFTGSLNSTESNLFAKEESSSNDKKLLDKFPLSKIYEIQDLFYNVSDKEFNELAPEYVEELIKLSSVIMHRVKNSNYYTKS